MFCNTSWVLWYSKMFEEQIIERKPKQSKANRTDLLEKMEAQLPLLKLKNKYRCRPGLMGSCCTLGELSSGLCDNLEGGGMMRGWRVVQKEGTHVQLWLIYIFVWQKPTRYCKEINLQFKINK